MSTKKFTKAEAMRKSIHRSREDALSELSSEDKLLYSQLLLGTSDAMRDVRKASLGTPLYDASNYLLADYYDVIELVRRLNEPEDSSGASTSFVTVASSSTAATTPSSGFPGLPSMGTQNVSSGLPAMGTPVVGASQSTVAEIQELLDAWEHRYGHFSGIFEQDLIDKALKSQNKELVLELIDRDIFRIDSVQEVKFQKEGVTYIRQKEYDIKKVPMYEYLMQSKTTALYEILTEHPVGKEMFLKAAYDLQYNALRFAFDTSNKILLEGMLDSGVDISSMRDAEHNTPLICDFIYRVQEGDEEQLRLLVERGASLTDTDQLLSTPLMVAARIGNLKAMEFLLQYDVHDLYAKNIHGETVLSLVEAGPERRRESQESYDEGVANAKERFTESKQAWEVQARAAEAAGKKPPDEPQEPKFRPRPEDYPLELVSLIQDAWVMGDPTQSKQALLISENQKPDDFAMDFDAEF